MNTWAGIHIYFHFSGYWGKNLSRFKINSQCSACNFFRFVTKKIEKNLEALSGWMGRCSESDELKSKNAIV